MTPSLLLFLLQPLFSLCLLLLNSFLTMIMSFYKKSFPSFLGSDRNATTTTPPTTSTPYWKSSCHPNNHHHLSNGLGLINQVSSNDTQRSPNVLESASIKSMLSPLLLPRPMIRPKRDPGGIGFIDDIGGGVDGLMSCTESLGFESSDERLVNDDDHHMVTNCNSNDSAMISLNHDNDDHDIDIDHERLRYWRIKRSRRQLSSAYGDDKVKNFPPPLSSLNHNGQPSFFLRPVRKEGRLELMEVRIDRPPKILQASRQDGRLRLHLVRKDDDTTNKDNVRDSSIQEEEEEEVAAVEKEELEIEEEGEEEEGVVDQNVDNFDDENRYKDSIGEWRFNSAGGDQGLRRCNNQLGMIGHHHHQHHHRNPLHHFHVWSPNCLTIR